MEENKLNEQEIVTEINNSVTENTENVISSDADIAATTAEVHKSFTDKLKSLPDKLKSLSGNAKKGIVLTALVVTYILGFSSHMIVGVKRSEYESLQTQLENEKESHNQTKEKYDKHIAIDVKKRIRDLDLNNISWESFKPLTIIKQEYDKLSDEQKKLVTNYNIYEQADKKYQKLKDERIAAVSNWGTAAFLPMDKDIKVETQHIIKKDDSYLFVVVLTNTSDTDKKGFRLRITEYDKSWTKKHYVSSDKIYFFSKGKRKFEFPLDPNKVDAVSISSYEQVENGEDEMYDLGEQKVNIFDPDEAAKMEISVGDEAYQAKIELMDEFYLLGEIIDDKGKYSYDEIESAKKKVLNLAQEYKDKYDNSVDMQALYDIWN